jgi:hypothetical protein
MRHSLFGCTFGVQPQLQYKFQISFQSDGLKATNSWRCLFVIFAVLDGFPTMNVKVSTPVEELLVVADASVHLAINFQVLAVTLVSTIHQCTRASVHLSNDIPA